MSKKLYKFAGNFLKCVCIVHCVSEYVGNIVLCVGPSMEPTLYENDVLIAERISIRLQKFGKGDIVVVKCPLNPQQYVCKRIVGLPGDKVQRGITVPPDHIWVEGDNSFNSTDSRSYGPVPQHFLRARALCKIAPLNDITLFVTK